SISDRTIQRPRQSLVSAAFKPLDFVLVRPRCGKLRRCHKGLLSGMKKPPHKTMRGPVINGARVAPPRGAARPPNSLLLRDDVPGRTIVDRRQVEPRRNVFAHVREPDVLRG